MNLLKAFNAKTGILATVLLAGTFAGCAKSPGPQEKSYSDFIRDVESRKVTYAQRVDSKSVINYQEDKAEFFAYAPKTENFLEDVKGKVPSYSVKAPEDNSASPFMLLLNFAPLLFMGAIGFVMYKQIKSAGGASGAMSFGKSKAKLLGKLQKKATFKDVAGCDEAKGGLEQVVDFLREPQKYQKLGARIPKGVLLIGPPGTGKTLLARAVAGEANVPFYSISGSDFVEMFVGVGASRVRDLFEQGKKNAPCIIFIDEIDAVGRKRGAGLGGGHDEREQTLNQILVEMDGFEGSDGVILLASTNRPDVLDPALLRPGRFDRQVNVGKPDANGRAEILKVHTRKMPLAPDVDLAVLARGTPGFTGAELANLANEAALDAARENKKLVDMGNFEHAKDTIMLGEEFKSRHQSPEDRRTFAYHEAGHAVVTLHCPHSDPIHKASILSRGKTGGVVWRLPVEDRTSMRLSHIKADLAVACGGRIAEELTFDGDISTGASADIGQVTSLTHAMVTQWAMGGKELGFLSYASDEQEVFLGKSVTETKKMAEETGRKVDAAVKKLADEAEETARRILTEHQDELERVAQALLEYEELTGAEVALAAAGKPLNRAPGSIAFAQPAAPLIQPPAPL